MSLVRPSHDTWESLKDDIVRWCFEGTYATAEKELRRRGHHVTPKMIRDRVIKHWGLHKNNRKANNMTIRAPRQQLREDQHKRRAAQVRHIPSSGIKEFESNNSSFLSKRPPHNGIEAHLRQSDGRFDEALVFNPDSTIVQLPASNMHVADSKVPTPALEGLHTMQRVPRFLRNETYAMCDQAVFSVSNYCRAYVETGIHLRHFEPRVHRDTFHAMFAQGMQDGFSLFGRSQQNEGLIQIKDAFKILKRCLHDPHPMLLAIIVGVVCDLSTRHSIPDHQKKQIQQHLLRGIATYQALPQSSPFRLFFAALLKSDKDAVELALSGLRAVRDILINTLGASDWRSLYVDERFCDNLYYAGLDGGRVESRRLLLQKQEEVYGSTARNVLWTLTNVANDHLLNMQLDQAERLYILALERAEAHKGFDRAKTRFAATEGLADVYIQRASALHTPGSSTRSVSVPEPDYERWAHLWIARSFLEQAESDASQWFDRSTSRRYHRIQDRLRRFPSGL